MKEYTIKLNEELNLTSALGDSVNQPQMVLQVWQDLCKMNSEHEEDLLIKNILEQILVQDYGSLEKVPVPEYYSRVSNSEGE